MTGAYRVLQRAAAEADLDHVAASLVHGFLDRDRHFTCLAATEADPAVAIANDGQRGEA